MEEWRAIPGYPGYEASNHGRIRSWRKGVRGDPERRAVAPRVLKPGIDKDGYHKYTLSKAGKLHYKRGHTLVLESFIGPAPEGAVGCHKDGSVDNNRPENLRWGTQRENILDKHQHGTFPSRHVDRRTVLNAFAVYAIREQVFEGEAQKDVAAYWGLRPGQVSAIALGNRWKWVGGPIKRQATEQSSNNREVVSI